MEPKDPEIGGSYTDDMTPTAGPTAIRGPYAKTAKRRQDIIDAATSVFATQGYHGGSLRDISRRLNLSLTSVVHHFPTKSELLIAVLENADHTGAGWVKDRSVIAGFEVTLNELIVSNLSRPELLRLFAVLSTEASDPDHPAHTWFVRRYDRVIQEMSQQILFDQSAGRIDREIDAVEVSKLIVAAWDGLQLQWLIKPSEDMAGSMSRLLALLLHPAPTI